MIRRFFVNWNARIGDVFGVFADAEAAVVALLNAGRDERTHTMQRVEGVGVVVRARGYRQGGAR